MSKAAVATTPKSNGRHIDGSPPKSESQKPDNKALLQKIEYSIDDRDYSLITSLFGLDEKLAEEELLKLIAKSMYNPEFRDQYNIDNISAMLICGAARDQLELLGADITDIIKGYNIPHE